jgi:gluconolactonase
MANDSYEILDERFRRCVKTREPVERLWSGGKWTEGPVYAPASRSLIWSDIPNDRRMRWDETTGGPLQQPERCRGPLRRQRLVHRSRLRD